MRDAAREVHRVVSGARDRSRLDQTGGSGVAGQGAAGEEEGGSGGDDGEPEGGADGEGDGGSEDGSGERGGRGGAGQKPYQIDLGQPASQDGGCSLTGGTSGQTWSGAWIALALGLVAGRRRRGGQ